VSRVALLAERGLLARAGIEGGEGVVPVPRAERRRPSRRSPRWADLDAEATLETLVAAPRDAIVLARPVDADPGAACLAPLARLVGLDVLALPAAADLAAWTVAVAATWAATGEPNLVRALAVAAALGESEAALPRRPWGASGVAVPAVRPAVLARWAARAWRPCRWCRRGGGLLGVVCGRCGAAPALEAAP
jgi:hypothetical protein